MTIIILSSTMVYGGDKNNSTTHSTNPQTQTEVSE